jgi:hypothetical protein
MLNPNEPLWLPPGSIRALGFIGLLAVVAGCIFSKIEIPKELWGIFGVVVGWYFGARYPSGAKSLTGDSSSPVVNVAGDINSTPTEITNGNSG